MPIISTTRRLLLTLALGSVACAAFAQHARAAAPAASTLPGAITLVVPQAPGGSNDTMARALAARLSKVVDSSVIVHNRPGANGNLGSAWVAESAPKDGSVWLVTVNSTMTINPFLYDKTGFDPVADFSPVAGVAVVPHVLLTRPDVPAGSMADVLELARKEPGKYTFGSSGNGTFSHLLMEQMKHSQSVDLTHVPYKGVAPALTDLIGGQLHYVISTVPAAMPFITSGQLKPISVTSLAPSKALPDVPLADDTVPGMVGELWVALYAPRGTPDELISQMHEAVQKVHAMPDMQTTLEAQGAMPMLAGPDEINSLTTTEMERWGPIVKSSGMRID
ncbi:tripartite tricarboxylate transporter substrate binding protein [Alcaligenaceae bacterium]|nr:tripartite tricarboxylate transporter substrate binding protein [Alcaligenaceae bacterium]